MLSLHRRGDRAAESLGKGMAGLIGLIRKGHFKPDENVVFVHTGGSAALFGYMDAFQAQLPNEIDTRNIR